MMSSCPTQLNFANHIIETNKSRANKLAYIDDFRSISYAELEQEIRLFSGLLADLDVQREQRVLLLMQDVVEWPVVFLGSLYAGVIPVAVNTLLSVTDYAYMLEHSRSQVAFVSENLLPTLLEAMQQSQHEIKKIVVTQLSPENKSEIVCSFEDLMGKATARDVVNTLADEFAFWLYSSGSTGRPKGVVHSHANLWYTAELYGKPILGIKANDVMFSAAKLFFAYGLGNGLTFPLAVGATTVLMSDRPTPDAVYKRLVGPHQPTVFCGVPTLYASMLADPAKPSADQVSIRICASAGESLSREVGTRFKEQFHCDILDGIGSTEMLHIFLSNREGDVHYGTTGKPVPGYEIELRDEDGVAVADGEIGDLYIKGPSAAVLYWNNRQQTQSTFLGTWLKSGDKYRCDDQGYYVYAGRSDDMIKVSGQYVSPVEVESALMEHRSVLEVAVIGVGDENGLMKTCAYVVLRDGVAPSPELEQDLKDHVKTLLALFKYPRLIYFVEELPKTATGKIQRFRLRQDHVEDRVHE